MPHAGGGREGTRSSILQRHLEDTQVPWRPQMRCKRTHMHAHACICMHMHTHSCTHMHAHTHTCTHMDTHTHAHTNVHACTGTRMHTRMHIRAPTCLHHTHVPTRLRCPQGHAPGPASCVPLGLWSPRSRQTGSAAGTGCSPAPSLADGWLRVPLLQDTGTGPGCLQPAPSPKRPPHCSYPPTHTHLQHKERGCPCHPRATSILNPGGATWSPWPSRCRGTHSEMISGGRFLGTALESTQKAVSRVQEQLGGQGGGRGGLRPPAGSQNQAKARRRRRRAESWSLGILLQRCSSIPGLALLWPPQLVPLCPGAAAKTFILFFLLLSLFFLPLRFQRGGAAMPEAGGTRGTALRRTMLLCCGEEGGKEGGMRLSDSTSIPGDAGPRPLCGCENGGMHPAGELAAGGCSGMGGRRVPAGAMPPQLCLPVVAAVPPAPAALAPAARLSPPSRPFRPRHGAPRQQ